MEVAMENTKTIDQYTTLKIEDRGEYGWQLTEGWIRREGDFKPKWCKIICDSLCFSINCLKYPAT